MANCMVCNTAVSDRDEVCSECGTDLTQLKASSEPSLPIEPAASPVETTTSSSSSLPYEPTTAPEVTVVPSEQSVARIVLKSNGVTTPEVFLIQGKQVLIGRFDADTGPVDIDLGRLPESATEHISRNHAEMVCDTSGQWLIKDLGTKNGTFFRPVGQAKWARVTEVQAIHDGDEIALGNVQFEFRIDTK